MQKYPKRGKIPLQGYSAGRILFGTEVCCVLEDDFRPLGPGVDTIPAEEVGTSRIPGRDAPKFSRGHIPVIGVHTTTDIAET